MRPRLFREAVDALIPNATCKIENLQIVEWNDSRPQPTQEELDNKIKELLVKEPWRLLRNKRTDLLYATDYKIKIAEKMGETVSEECLTYRQQLRDLPANCDPQLDENGNLTNVTWPEEPNA
jgi:hypothetical protein